MHSPFNPSQEAPESGLRIVKTGKYQLGEGPHWCESQHRLYWVDIVAPAIHSLPADGTEQNTITLGELVGAVVPVRTGGLLAATQSGLYQLDDVGGLSLVASPESELPDNRFNDGKCDSSGRFWVGSLSMQSRKGAGCLWMVTSEGHCRKMETGLDISNGLGWSPDEQRFYLTDSGRGIIYEYDYDVADGAITNRRCFARVDPHDGVPDGLTVDADGFIWSARWDGSCVVRYDPEGKVERKVELPVPRPTSCALGGIDGTTLFVTSARVGLSDFQLSQAPHSGSIFALDAPSRGLPECQFG